MAKCSIYWIRFIISYDCSLAVSFLFNAINYRVECVAWRELFLFLLFFTHLIASALLVCTCMCIVYTHMNIMSRIYITNTFPHGSILNVFVQSILVEL